MKYTFDIPDMTASDGYTTLKINDGLAEVDESNPILMALVKKFGGSPAPEKPKPKAKKDKD